MPDLEGLNARRWGKLSANAILFYGVVPALFGIIFAGLTHPQLSAAQWPLHLVQIYSVAVVFCGWLIRDACSATVAHFWRKRGLSLPLTLIFGALGATVIVFPFSISLQSAFEALLIPQHLHVAHTRWEPLLTMDPAFVSNAIVNHILPSAFLWTATSLVFFHLLGMPRYGYPPSTVFAALRGASIEDPNRRRDSVTTSTSTDAGRPAFMRLVPDNRSRDEIVALKAEQHYVRIYTRNGEDLVHEKFRSAVSDFVRCGGVQVHRSYAVNPEFISAVESENGTYSITMSNGLNVPVSRSHTAVARQLSESRAVV